MAIEATTSAAPSYWACYFINGDCSHMTDAEIAIADAWQHRQEPWYVVSIVEDSERFTWHYRLHGGDAEGGDVCDYVLHKA